MAWRYVPRLVADPDQVIFRDLYETLRTRVRPGTSQYRHSCVFGKSDYTHLREFPWEEAPLIMKMRELVELYAGKKVDYCLAHIYIDGKAGIGWHYDEEALASDVYSLSFGTPRKFRLRERGQTRGWVYEQVLSNGDLFHMLPECQRTYEHCVPPQTTIKTPRVNLTFRSRQ